MRLIDADAMEKMMCDTVQGDIRGYPYSDTQWEMAFKWIDHQPTIDAVPVVRCKDCVYCDSASDGWCQCENTGAGMPLDGFCSDGERKDGADNG